MLWFLQLTRWESEVTPHLTNETAGMGLEAEVMSARRLHCSMCLAAWFFLAFCLGWTINLQTETTAKRRDQKPDFGSAGSAPDHDDCHVAARWLAAGDDRRLHQRRSALYFLCGLGSQKAANLARDDRVSLTIDHVTPDLMAITGLSMAAHAQAVVDPAEANKVLRMLPLKDPEKIAVPMPSPEDVRIFRVTPTVISVLGYSKDFGHTELVTC